MARRRKSKKSQLKNLKNLTHAVYGPGPCKYAEFCGEECTPECENYPDRRALETELEEEKTG